MELVQLQCFIALAETLNFKKAAERVYISQSSMSRYIAGLESELQTALFERGKNFASTKLTAAGKYFLPKARDLLQMADTTQASMQQFSSAQYEQQPLTVGIDMRLSHGLIPGLIYEYSKSVPYQISMQTLPGEQIPKILDNGEMDLGLAIHINEKYLNRISCQVLSKLPMMLFVHEDVLARCGSEDPTDILRREKIVTIAEDIKINAHIMSILYEMGVQPAFQFCDSPWHMDFMVNTCKAVSILPDTAKVVEPAIHQIPIPPEFGSLLVYALSPFETAENTAIIDHLREKLNT